MSSSITVLTILVLSSTLLLVSAGYSQQQPQAKTDAYNVESMLFAPSDVNVNNVPQYQLTQGAAPGNSMSTVSPSSSDSSNIYFVPLTYSGVRLSGDQLSMTPPPPAAAAASYSASPIAAAVQSRHQVAFVNVPVVGDIKPTLIEVGANVLPVQILFRSASSLLNVLQHHQGATGEVKETASEDEPHRLIHRVTKPIIQEITEVITPMRFIRQEVLPVQEEINTLVARGVGMPVTNKAQIAENAVFKQQKSPEVANNNVVLVSQPKAQQQQQQPQQLFMSSDAPAVAPVGSSDISALLKRMNMSFSRKVLNINNNNNHNNLRTFRVSNIVGATAPSTGKMTKAVTLASITAARPTTTTTAVGPAGRVLALGTNY